MKVQVPHGACTFFIAIQIGVKDTGIYMKLELKLKR